MKDSRQCKNKAFRFSYRTYQLSLLLSVVIAAIVLVFMLSKTEFSLPSATKPISNNMEHVYVTWDRCEVDRWVAAWLIKRFLNPAAEFILIPPGSSMAEGTGTAFDIPGGRWCRTADQSVSELVYSEIDNNDSALIQILSLVRKIELAYWRLSKKDVEAKALHANLLKIYESQDQPAQRIEALFNYLDRIYQVGGIVK